MPADWSEAGSATPDEAAVALAGILLPQELSGFAEPAIRIDGEVVTFALAGPGSRGFELVAARGSVLTPPIDVDAEGVEVRRTVGRYSPERGDLEWIERGITYSLRSDTLSLGELLRVATGLRRGMRRSTRGLLWIALPLALGIVIGATAMAVLEDPPTIEATFSTEVDEEPVPVPEPDGRVLLVWTSGGLPADLAARVAALPSVRAATVVGGDTVNLATSTASGGEPLDAPPLGAVIPLDALAIDPPSYGRFFDKATQARLRGLRPGEALLGATSASLRRAGPGAVLQLDNGARLTVAGVIDDAVVGAAEVVVDTATAPAVGVLTPRFLLVSFRGDRTALEREISALLPPGEPARFRSRGETPYLRHADAVLPQAIIKQRFGEFSYRPPSAGRFFETDPAWSKLSVVTATVPILGSIRCHRAVLPAIEGALRELETRNLGFLVDRNGYQGCFQPSVIPDRGGISRHSWGVALDLNFTKNPTGLASAVDPRLVEVFERWGFISGANWLIPDPGHFEYLRPPRV